MSAEAPQRVDLLIDLTHPAIAWEPLHHGLEELDEAGFVPHRLHVLPEEQLARVDGAFGGTLGAKLNGGGAWLIERKNEQAPIFVCGETPEVQAVTVPGQLVGVAGFRGSVTRAPRMAYYVTECSYGVVGPFSLDGELAPFRLTMTLGVLFAMREQGYRKAVLPGVKIAALPALREMLGTAITAEHPIALRPKPRVVVCASGNGTNFQAVLDAVAAGVLDLDICRLLVNRESAFAQQRAALAGIPSTCILWKRAEETRDKFDARVTAAVAQEQPDLVLLLGWMHLLPKSFVLAFPDLLNIHPAYLPVNPSRDRVILPDETDQPAFRGAHAVDDAVEAGAKWVGATVHRVTAHVDRGEVLARVPIYRIPGEEDQQLRERLHIAEHTILIAALQRWLDER